MDGEWTPWAAAYRTFAADPLRRRQHHNIRCECSAVGGRRHGKRTSVHILSWRVGQGFGGVGALRILPRRIPAAEVAGVGPHDAEVELGLGDEVDEPP